MGKKIILLVSFATLSFLISCQSNSQKENSSQEKEIPAPLLDLKSFFKGGNKTSVLFSPDGNYFSYRADYKGRMNIFVQKTTDTIAVRVTNDTLRSIGRYFWKGDRIVYSQDAAGDENYQLFSVKADGSDLKALTPFPNVNSNVIDALTEIPGKEKEVLVGMNKRVQDCFDPYLLNIETGTLKLLYNTKKIMTHG